MHDKLIILRLAFAMWPIWALLLVIYLARFAGRIYCYKHQREVGRQQ